jgi:1-acyl-sn-glycerol-3-phosphate acyltransferase
VSPLRPALRTVRRALLVPLVVGVEALVVLAGPGLLVGAAVLSRRQGHRRVLRAVGFAVGYAALELATLRRVLGLRRVDSAAGGGNLDAAWQALVARYLARLYRLARLTLDIGLTVDPASDPPPNGRPVLVLARHRGPGDSFLLAWLLVVRWRRRLGVVLTNRLRADPIVDFAGDRLPFCFVGGRGRRGHRAVLAGIGRLAGAAGAQDAILLFPEGHNFSSGRRQAALARLRRLGERRLLRRATRLVRLLPPRPGGVAAALEARPDLTVIVLGHTGLGAADRPWWRLPVGSRVTVRTWVYPPGRTPPPEVPAVQNWLLDRWAEVDAWLATAPPARG